jgi:leader peptidase (prepilin peptidase)/N-methyltransferase
MDLDIEAKDSDMLSIILYAIVGLLVGGLLNTLADTLPPKGRIRPPFCQHCLAPRPWLNWLATLACVLGRRDCAQCGAPIPTRNIIVELSTVITFGYLMAEYGLTGHSLLLSTYLAIFILVIVIDIEHRLVLNRVIFPAILLALVAGPFTPGLNWKLMLVGGLVGFGIFYVIALIYPGGMGAGDVKLAAFIGLITGFPDVFLAVIVAILAGGLISLILVLTRTRSTRDYIPYGPFLVIGGVFTLLWGQPLVDSYVDIEETHHDGIVVARVLEVDPPREYPFDPTIIAPSPRSFANDLGLFPARD